MAAVRQAVAEEAQALLLVFPVLLQPPVALWASYRLADRQLEHVVWQAENKLLCLKHKSQPIVRNYFSFFTLQGL